jgi:hypothetical protein
MMDEFAEEYERLKNCRTWKEFARLTKLSPWSPEYWWAEMAWRVARRDGPNPTTEDHPRSPGPPAPG